MTIGDDLKVEEVQIEIRGKQNRAELLRYVIQMDTTKAEFEEFLERFRPAVGGWAEELSEASK